MTDSATATLLFANEAFYDAFRLRDYSAMEQLWASSVDVACVHPGWPAVMGRDAVLRSWKGILTGEHAPDIHFRAPKPFVQGTSGFVICYETLGSGVLVASNVFVREEGTWKLVHHQAGPCDVDPKQLEEPEPQQMQ